MSIPASPWPVSPSPGIGVLGGIQPAASAMSLSWREIQPGANLSEEREDVAVLLPLDGAAFTASVARWPGQIRQTVVADPAVCVVPPRARLELACEHPSELLVIALDGERWTERTQEALGLVPEIRDCHVGMDPFIRRIADLLSKAPAADAGCGAWVDALAEDFGIHLATRYGRPAEAAAYAGLAPHRLQRVLAIIDERLDGPIPVHELAAEVHMSPYHFARMFKQSTGQAPHLYITWQRMDRAKDLLAQTTLPLAEVAKRVGYRTQAHFTGVFHERVGITPRAYRLRCRRVEARPAWPVPRKTAEVLTA
jgi:AraC family transcriptional regulator